MLVCHCNVVNDREIRDTIVAGATDLEAVARSCGAGGDCQGCVPLIEELIEEAAMAFSAPEELRTLQAGRRRAGMPADAAVA